jgi:hypothetical protein
VYEILYDLYALRLLLGPSFASVVLAAAQTNRLRIICYTRPDRDAKGHVPRTYVSYQQQERSKQTSKQAMMLAALAVAVESSRPATNMQNPAQNDVVFSVRAPSRRKTKSDKSRHTQSRLPLGFARLMARRKEGDKTTFSIWNGAINDNPSRCISPPRHRDSPSEGLDS